MKDAANKRTEKKKTRRKAAQAEEVQRRGLRGQLNVLTLSGGLIASLFHLPHCLIPDALFASQGVAF